MRITGRGAIDADVMFISSAPGRHEQYAKRAFAGPAGHELEKMLATAGLDYSRCHFDNVCQEVLDERERERYDYTVWYADLLSRVKAVNPHVVVPLGDPALVALAGRHGIMKWRGSILESTAIAGLKVIPTIDPAFLLRGNYVLRRPSIWDLERVREEVTIPSIDLPKWDFVIRPSHEQYRIAMDRLWKAERLVYDIEGSGSILCIGIGNETDFAISIPFYRSDGTSYWPEDVEVQVWREIAELLQSGKETGGQNVPYDWLNLYAYRVKVGRPIWDSMRMHNEVWSELPHSLAFLTSVYTRQPYYKDEGKTWEKGISEDRFWTYNCLDVVCTGEAIKALRKEMEELGVTEHYHRHYARLFPILIEAEISGLSVHNGRQKKHLKLANEKIAQLEPQLSKRVGRELNIRSHKQMTEFITNDLKLKIPYNRKTGKQTVNEDALNKILIGQDSDLLKLILDLRGVLTLRSTFLEPKVGGDGRLHCHYSYTETQRLKSAKSVLGSGTNLQNQPESVRDMFVVDDPAFLFGSYDLSQAEDRWVAWSAPVPKKQELYRAGKKVHTFFASIISQAYTGKHLEYHEIPKDNSPKSLYFTAKRTVHGNNYDLGLEKFAMLILQPVNIARVLQELYHRTFPEIAGIWWKRIQEQLKTNRMIRNPDGSCRIFLERFDQELYRSAYAHEPQEGVCFHMNQTLVVLHEAYLAALDSKTKFDDYIASEGLVLKNHDRVFDALRESRLIIKLQVHDSGLFQVVASTAPFVAQVADARANKPIVGLVGGPFVIPAEHTVGPAWGIQRGYDIYADNASAMCERISKTYQRAIRMVELCHENYRTGLSHTSNIPRNTSRLQSSTSGLESSLSLVQSEQMSG